MGLSEILLLAVGLSMDAFAISVCKGLAMKRSRIRDAVICGIWFGGSQALMPLIGYLLGANFEKYIEAVAPWVAFALLAIIGGNMIREALFGGEEEADASLSVRAMLPMAVATSIDALAVGITFACVPIKIAAASALVNTLIGVTLIGVITFSLSCVGVKVGNVFGTKYKSKAELAGGIILVLLGIKIILEHFGVL